MTNISSLILDGVFSLYGFQVVKVNEDYEAFPKK